jgi:hypothetical protein
MAYRVIVDSKGKQQVITLKGADLKKWKSYDTLEGQMGFLRTKMGDSSLQFRGLKD